MPNADECKKPLLVLQKFNDHTNDKLLLFAGAGAVTLFTNVNKFVKAICEGSSPSFQGATETPFFKCIKDQLLLFAELETGAVGTDDVRVLRGIEAVQQQYAKVSKMEAPSHGDLTMLFVFCWCLSRSEMENVKVWKGKATTAGARASTAAEGPADASSSSALPKAGLTKVKQQKAKHLDDMTRSLFQR